MRVDSSSALRADEFHSLMATMRLPESTRLALAVSGGPDSMALAILTKNWCVQNCFPAPIAFIVDHGLRAESAAEAATVKERLRELGIEAEILLWEHGIVASRVHSEARKGRYRLLIDACKKRGISRLLFAHQQDDQAETVLMRLAKGTGIAGLAGIPASSVIEGVRILRPLLPVPKERLVATCQAAGIAFVEDPSNGMAKFARGRLRRVMPLLAEEGLTVERLVDLAARAAEANEALDLITKEFLHAAYRRDDYGVVSIEKKKLLDAPRAVALRALGFGLQGVHAEDYEPQRASLLLLLDALRRDEPVPVRTLHGCLIGESKGFITIIREFSAITDCVVIGSGQSVTWDGRWQVSLAERSDMDGLEVKALGNPPHDVLDRLAPDLRHKIPQGRVRAALPALWRGEEIALIPFLSKDQEAVHAALDTSWPPVIAS